MEIYINCDRNKETAIKTHEKLVEYCNKLNIIVTDDVESADIIFSIGGDGTFLESARLSVNAKIIGVNCGTLGYLTDIKPDDLKKSLESILNDDFYIEKRMMLDGEILKGDGSVVSIPPALNEIAISKNTFGVVRFDAIVDDKLINSYTADGILVCTPTGSTAYNLSCGGPIVDPTAEILTLTPIAPHSVINRSIILSDTSEVKIKITELRDNTSSYVLFDGRPIEVTTGDVVRIRKSDFSTNIIKLNWQSFIDNVRNTIN